MSEVGSINESVSKATATAFENLLVVLEPAVQEAQKDGAICRSALASRQGVPRWDDRKASRNSVAEAERRGLTPEKCSALLEQKTGQ